MAQQEVDHQKIQVLHEFDGVDYNLTFIDPTTGRSLTTIGLPADQMVALVSAVIDNLRSRT